MSRLRSWLNGARDSLRQRQPVLEFLDAAPMRAAWQTIREAITKAPTPSGVRWLLAPHDLGKLIGECERLGGGRAALADGASGARGVADERCPLGAALGTSVPRACLRSVWGAQRL